MKIAENSICRRLLLCIKRPYQRCVCVWNDLEPFEFINSMDTMSSLISSLFILWSASPFSPPPHHPHYPHGYHTFVTLFAVFSISTARGKKRRTSLKAFQFLRIVLFSYFFLFELSTFSHHHISFCTKWLTINGEKHEFDDRIFFFIFLAGWFDILFVLFFMLSTKLRNVMHQNQFEIGSRCDSFERER